MGILKKYIAMKIAASVGLGLLGINLALYAVMHLLSWGREGIPVPDWMVLSAVVFMFLQAGLVVMAVIVVINRPLQVLNRSMRRVEEGNLAENCEWKSEDEFGELGKNFNRMIRSIHQINDSRKQIEQRLIKAEESLKYKLALEDKAKIIERMNRELSSAFNDITLLYTVSQYLSTVVEHKELVDTIKKIFTERFSCDAFVLYFTSADGTKLNLACAKGIASNYLPEGSNQGIAGETVLRRRSLYVSDILSQPDLMRSSIEQSLRGAVFSVPLLVRDTVIGVLTVSRDHVDGLSPTDRQSLESIANQIAVAYDKCQLYTQTKELSVRDELTGAYNRRHFQHMLQLEFKRAKRFSRPIALLMVDVDHFKQYNDNYGHLKGDELLKLLTTLLQKNIREVDLLSRFGGEEFMIMLTDTNLEDAVYVANKLRKIVKMQLKLGDENMPADRIGQGTGVTVSIGVSTYPECALQPRQLINSADMALYMAKKDGRDLVRSAQTTVLPLEELMA